MICNFDIVYSEGDFFSEIGEIMNFDFVYSKDYMSQVLH